jgi:hypothetical protein
MITSTISYHIIRKKVSFQKINGAPLEEPYDPFLFFSVINRRGNVSERCGASNPLGRPNGFSRRLGQSWITFGPNGTASLPGITVPSCRVASWFGTEFEQDDLHQLRLHQGEQEFDVQARWVVDATGRSSVLKRQLGLARDVGPNVNAVWFRVAHRIAVDEWSNDPSWQARVVDGSRYLSTVHLCGDGYWVWLIPPGLWLDEHRYRDRCYHPSL